VPYLTLMNETAPQRQHSLRELFNGLRYVIRCGIAWIAKLSSESSEPAECCYATPLHELAYWTSNESRCNRQLANILAQTRNTWLGE
jgi:hypothetical protein